MSPPITRPSELGVQPRARHEPDCDCPACFGLRTLERPRFFAGQLITEADLTSAQEYVRAKSQLHNRYLHGPGVVCGLEVVCHPECKGWVIVRPGYAIDPCGEDVVVPCPHELDVLKLIRECRDRKRRTPGRPDCEPIRPASEAGDCSGEGELWCVTIAYEEQETRATTALRRRRKSVAGCGCHETANGNGNGHEHEHEVSAIGQCEPTRVSEGYRLDVVRAEGEYAKEMPEFAVEVADRTAAARSAIEATLGQELTNEGGDALAAMAAEEPDATPDLSPAVMANALGGLRAAALTLFRRDPLRVRCQVPDLPLDERYSPGMLKTPTRKREAKQGALQTLEAISSYANDYVCGALLPRCGSDPCEDRLVLACLRISGDDVLDICNFERRRFAGAFPSVFHWMEMTGALGQLTKMVRSLCCVQERRTPEWPKPTVGPAPAPEPAAPPGAEAPGGAGHPPPGGWPATVLLARSSALTAAPSQPAELLSAAGESLSPEAIARLAPGRAASLRSLVGESLKTVNRAVEKAGADLTVRHVESAAEIPLDALLRAPGQPAEGEQLVAYALPARDPDKAEVIAFGRDDPAAEAESRMSSVEEELGKLRKEVARLRRAKPTRGGAS